jgi:fructose transport system substrate-binding protein
VKFAKDGSKPKPPAGKSFIDTGVTLITDKPVDGVASKVEGGILSVGDKM